LLVADWGNFKVLFTAIWFRIGDTNASTDGTTCEFIVIWLRADATYRDTAFNGEYELMPELRA
jgi:hypothetical protein